MVGGRTGAIGGGEVFVHGCGLLAGGVPGVAAWHPWMPAPAAVQPSFNGFSPRRRPVHSNRRSSFIEPAEHPRLWRNVSGQKVRGEFTRPPPGGRGAQP